MDCSRVIRRRNGPRGAHRCETVRCPSCCLFVNPMEHRCFLLKIEPKKPSEKIIYFDFETDQELGEHVVNFAVAQYFEGGEEVFSSYSVCEDFCGWLFREKHKEYTAVAHNMRG